MRATTGKDYHSGWEQLRLAVHALAEHPGSLQDRLQDASLHHVMHVAAEHVPDAQAQALTDLRARLTTAEPGGDEGSILVTTRRMSDDDARAGIEPLLALYDAVTRAVGAAEAQAGRR
jgi:hypothetical protein